MPNLSRPWFDLGLLVLWPKPTCLPFTAPSPLCAQTSHLTFTIAYRPPRRTQHLHIHKLRDTSHNATPPVRH